MYNLPFTLTGGIALGLTVSSTPLYIMDTASINLRGPLGTLTQVIIFKSMLFFTNYRSYKLILF